jgi:hypothetical protein
VGEIAWHARAIWARAVGDFAHAVERRGLDSVGKGGTDSRA